MSFWTAMVWIVAIFAVAGLLRSRFKAKAGITEDYLGNQTLNRPDDAEHDADGDMREEAAQAEIAELKERIAVLERIATDANTAEARETARIASEIEALRTPELTTTPEEKAD
ncbi:MAG: hypothetical protein AAFR64_08430 [Pseudomonadota bacterium]